MTTFAALARLGVADVHEAAGRTGIAAGELSYDPNGLREVVEGGD